MAGIGGHIDFMFLATSPHPHQAAEPDAVVLKDAL